MYSVARYFGLGRATGLDHFDLSYRTMPLVKKGIFKYSSNAMYTFAIPVFWSFGLLAGSEGALLLALFNHLFIWVHYYCTEKPDMDYIYGSPAASEPQPRPTAQGSGQGEDLRAEAPAADEPAPVTGDYQI